MREVANVLVGICAYNERERIGRLLKNLANQKLDSCFHFKKIVVVASGCTDRTEDIVLDHSKVNSLVELIVENERKGKTSAQNLILMKARDYNCHIVVFANADTHPENGAINKILLPLLNDFVGATCAKPVPITKSNNLTDVITNLMWYIHNRIAIEEPFLSGELIAFKLNLINRIPSTVPWEDIYISAVMAAKGIRFFMVDQASVYMTRTASTLSELYKQRLRYETGNLYIKQLLGYTKPTVRPSTVLKIMPNVVFGFGFKKIPIIIMASFIDLIARLHARFALLKSLIPFVW